MHTMFGCLSLSPSALCLMGTRLLSLERRWVCQSIRWSLPALRLTPRAGQPSFLEYFQLTTRPDGTQLLAATNGIFQTGAVIGTLTLPWFADRFGRKGGLSISALYCLISGAVLAGSTHIAMFLVFRFVAGAGAFMILAAVPVSVQDSTSECA